MPTYYARNAPPPAPVDHAVVFARGREGWVYVRRTGAATWERPGGCLEPGESVLDCAARELREETGATCFALLPVAAFMLDGEEGREARGGVLFFAQISELGPLPAGSEICEVRVASEPPGPLTYPQATVAHAQRVAEFLQTGWLVRCQ